MVDARGEASQIRRPVGDFCCPQVVDYSQRKGQSVAVTERWLATNLSYEPEDL